MSSTATLTIRLRPDVKEKLDRLAVWTRRSRSSPAGEALAAYVEREFPIIAGIQEGLEDMKAGRLAPHEEVMTEVRAVIEAVEAVRKAGAS